MTCFYEYRQKKLIYSIGVYTFIMCMRSCIHSCAYIHAKSRKAGHKKSCPWLSNSLPICMNDRKIRLDNILDSIAVSVFVVFLVEFDKCRI